MSRSMLAIILALAASACGRSEPAPSPPPGAVEAFTARIDRDEEAARREKMREAGLRGKERAIAAIARLEANERDRVAAQ